MSDKLILHIEVVGFNADSIQDNADQFYNGDVAFIITEELMNSECGLTLIGHPGEKEQNSDYTVNAMNGLIVGAEIKRSES